MVAGFGGGSWFVNSMAYDGELVDAGLVEANPLIEVMLHDRRLGGKDSKTGEEAAYTPTAVVNRERIGPSLARGDLKVFVVHASLAIEAGAGDFVAVGVSGAEHER